MTGARQPGKSHRWPASALRLVLIAALAVFSTRSPAAEPAVTVDPNSGLAISGVDPVAYFTDGKPVFGLPQLELSLLGAVWRFRNAGNRTAFMENPDIYSPQFNGYDPVAATRGRTVPGHPLIWSVTGERLYLFYDEADRAAFLADPERIIATAKRKWPELVGTIGR